MAHLMVFNLWVGPSFIFNSYFPVTNLGLDLYQVHIITSLLFLCCPGTENSLI